MNYILFLQEKPILTGCITVNGKTKQGIFKPSWNKYSNSLEYAYYTKNGNKGAGGFTMMRAYNLMNSGCLTVLAN